MRNTLLMTSSISVDKNMKFHNHIPEKDRLKQYISAVVFYIMESNFTDIVFVDWSWYDLNNLNFLKELASRFDKKIELLSFNNDQKQVVIHWKWYWENKIIEYALDNSDVLNKNDIFYKVTWRYIVKNINNIVKNEKNNRNVFFKISFLWKFGWMCNTAFFKCGLSEFQKNLWWVGENVYDEKWVYLEHIYFNAIKNNDFKVKCFKELPVFHWKAWWDWRDIDLNKRWTIIREICNKIWLYNI